MKITKFDLGNFNAAKPSEPLPVAPKNFSYFGKKEEKEQPEFTKTELDSKLTSEYKKAYEEGYNKGKEEVTQNALLLEQTTKGAVEKITIQIAEFLKSYEEEKKNYQRNMVKVTIAAIKKLTEKALKENSEQVLLEALERSANVFSGQPEIIFRAKKNILDKIKDKVDNILKEHDFKGTITYVPDETIDEGNCLLEWGKSGLSINSNEAMQEIENILSEYIKSI